MLGNIFNVNLAKFLTPLTLNYHWVNIKWECSISPKAPKFKLPLSFKYVFMIFIMKVQKSCYFRNHVLFICCIIQLWSNIRWSPWPANEPIPTNAPWMMDGKHRVTQGLGCCMAWNVTHLFFFNFSIMISNKYPPSIIVKNTLNDVSISKSKTHSFIGISLFSNA